MPLAKSITRQDIVNSISARVANYNSRTSYNPVYLRFISAREAGVRSYGSLAGWLVTPEAANAIYGLMDDFGMNARGSRLTRTDVFARNLSEITAVVDIAGLSKFTLDQGQLSQKLHNSTVVQELGKLFDFCSKERCFSESGGIVIGSKVAHAILPELCPMIDTSHIAISLARVTPGEYLPPSGSWEVYLGYTPGRRPNPSPLGGGRYSWGKDQFLCAIGFYARIYHDWQEANGNPGLAAFLSQDPAPGTTGIPRLLDKVFW